MTDTLAPRVTTTATITIRRLLSSTMVAAPLLLLAGTAVLPTAINGRHGADRTKSLQVLEAIAPDRGRLPVGLLLIVLGLALLVTAGFGLAWLAHGRPLSLLGAAMVAIGAPMGAASNTITAIMAYRLSNPSLAETSAVDAFAVTSGPVEIGMFLLYLLVFLGLILLAVAGWRARSLRWWQALLIGVGVLAGFAADEGPTGALFTLPFTVGMVLAARQLTSPSR
jgi:hypothetical protein